MSRTPRTRSPAKASPLQSGLEQVDEMIAWGRFKYPLAAENLKHWRDGTGKDKVIPARAFQSEPFFLDHLRTHHRPRFIQGARQRIAAKVLIPGRPVEMEWTDSVNAPYFTDLFYALGGFTVHSKVEVESMPQSTAQAVVLRFVSWKVEIKDEYDWDPGKSTFIPGFGVVTDDQMLALQHAGYGRNYRITSEWATITDKEATGPETIQLNTIGR
jgi:hypothetical protein